MGLLTANGTDILTASIDSILNGVWTANLTINQTDGNSFTPGTAVTISSALGYSLTGLVSPDRSGSLVDTVHCRVIGGKAGGMGVQVDARQFQACTVNDVVSSLVQASGETLSGTIDPALLSSQLGQWTVKQGSVSAALSDLLAHVDPKLNWRFLPDATLWFGSEAWATASGSYVVVDGSPIDGHYELGVDYPFLYVGQQIDGYKIAKVVHELDAEKVRSHIYTPTIGMNRGGLGAIQSIILDTVSYIDYYTTYDAKVISQSGTNVDIQPLDSRLHGLQNVPMKNGSAGISAQVQPGAIVKLGWDGGDQNSPYVQTFSGENAMTITITDATGDQININSGTITIKIGNTALFTLSSSGLAIGPTGALPVLVQGAFDSMGVPVTQSPASISFIKGS